MVTCLVRLWRLAQSSSSSFFCGTSSRSESPNVRFRQIRIKSGSTKNTRVAVLGSEPEILFYSGRRSATGYIYMYPLMEKHSYASRMQEEMIRELEAALSAYCHGRPVRLLVLVMDTESRRMRDEDVERPPIANAVQEQARD